MSKSEKRILREMVAAGRREIDRVGTVQYVGKFLDFRFSWEPEELRRKAEETAQIGAIEATFGLTVRAM